MCSLTVTAVRPKRVAMIAVIALFAFSNITSFAVGSLTLAWDPSSTSGVTYKVYYGPSSGTYTDSVFVGTATNAIVSNLVDGATYYFAATASDTNGLESDFSNEVSGMVNPPNQTPTLNVLANMVISEDAGLQTVSLSGISSGATNELQTLIVSASSSNPALIPTPTVNYASPNTTGSLTFTPVASAFGSAAITVTVNDGGTTNNIVTRVFTVTVSPVNDAPTLNPLSNISINENAGLQTVNLSGISSGAANENQTLTITATSSNPALIPAPTATYTSPNTTGSLTFSPVPAAYGSATITVTVNDGGTSNNVVSRLFTVTVNHLNQPPTISTITNVVIAIGTSTAALPFTINDLETAASSLTVSGSSDNQTLAPNANITLGGSGSNRTVTVTPTSGQTGTANITVSVSDGAASATAAFQLTVKRKPVPPGRVRIAAQ